MFRFLFYLVVGVLLVAAVAYTFSRRDRADDLAERFEDGAPSTAGASKYEVGGTVALVAAYKDVHGDQPDPAVVRSAYDDMLGQGLTVDKAQALRFFKERKAREESKKSGGGSGKNAKGGAEDAAEGVAGKNAKGDSKGGAEKDAKEDANEDDEEVVRKDPFLISVGEELDTLRNRIDALATRVRQKSGGARPFTPESRGAVSGIAGDRAFGERSEAPSRFDGRDNDSGDEASIRLAGDRKRASAGPETASRVEGFYSPW
jgi:hypothetical protein